MRFTPHGLVDAFDATDKFEGACRQLTNLVFDQSNPEYVVSRPGVTQLANLEDGLGPSFFVSVQIVIGSRVWGMAYTQNFYLKDYPFCYDWRTGEFIQVQGATDENLPFAPANTGEWVPPVMIAMGRYIIVTHPGFDNLPKYKWGSIANGGTSTLWRDGGQTILWGSTAQGGSNAKWGTIALGGDGFLWGEAPLWGDRYTFGAIDTLVPETPTWNALTTFPYPLTGPPLAVTNFSNRAYFAIANTVEYSDVLSLLRTNASASVTIGDNQDITALSGLPVQTTGSGILQTLSIFKANQVWKLGGDSATFNLSLDYVSLNIGTSAPRTIALSPFGQYFTSNAGPYFLDLMGTLRPVTHSQGELESDVITAFMNQVDPSRWCGAYNVGVYRVCGYGLFRGVTVPVDYWFDEHRRRWNGPHSFIYDCASPMGSDFMQTTVAFPNLLVKSEIQESTNFSDMDLATPIVSTLISSTFPKLGWLAIQQVIESTLELSSANASVLYNIYLQNENGVTLGNVALTVTSGGINWGDFDWADGTVWGHSNLWGAGSAWGPQGLAWGGGALWYGFQNYWTDVSGSGLRWGGGAQDPVSVYPLPWTAPVVSEKFQLRVDVQVSKQVGIGTFYGKFQKTGYMTFGPRRGT